MEAERRFAPLCRLGEGERRLGGEGARGRAGEPGRAGDRAYTCAGECAGDRDAEYTTSWPFSGTTISSLTRMSSTVGPDGALCDLLSATATASSIPLGG